MSIGDLERCAALHEEGGLVPLASHLFPEYTALGLLTNLAVAPRRRRTGLGRQLCARCAAGCAEWALPALALQVEEQNADARALYAAQGFEELWRTEGARALRLRPGARTFATDFFNARNAELLEEVTSTVVTMAKEVPRQGG
eukprot:Transcript_2103.p3 GENE.Transcript_2103~~Transcript_2103.p3  ORF type:complete len:143 (+),score=65.42 Transcript_2103:633-1061(+)